eukprot:TRINITY_DN2154_c0_g1_i11.p2 TRINITY_DN2154_c0_g1~~TRINITY_DN2154_c0_g1_i11.p2  ORF type:complete len:452 (+),score=103.22 TRINITY_DN2154_c0_g1_i11:51-1358(+)
MARPPRPTKGPSRRRRRPSTSSSSPMRPRRPSAAWTMPASGGCRRGEAAPSTPSPCSSPPSRRWRRRSRCPAPSLPSAMTAPRRGSPPPWFASASSANSPKSSFGAAARGVSGRAVGLRRDSTSSFPSRAVVCAVVFPIVSLRAYAAEAAYRSAAAPFGALGSGVLAPWRQAELAASAAAAAVREASSTGAARGWPLRLLWRLTPYGGSSLLAAFSSASLVSSFVLLTAWSRVHVGAHYPSDAGAGALFGALISSVGAWAHGLWGRSGCATASGACYYAPHAVSLTADTVWARLPYRGLAVAVVISYAVTLASFKGFWVKCSYVYGLLFSCVTLRWMLLCPVGGSPASPAVALPPLPVQSAGGHATVVAVFGALLAFGMATRGLRGVFRLINFTVTYFGSLVFIIAWRLRHAAPRDGRPALGAVAEAVLRRGTAA